MDIKMTDIMLHIDETLDRPHQLELEQYMRNQFGVIGLGYHAEKPHLMIVEFNPDRTTPLELLHSVENRGLHAELVGLL
ncbi:MAG: ATP-binding protein [Gammaproteobacteria bacterium]|nr:ATP-binding protein [Gammaproteobacteria bacterium]